MSDLFKNKFRIKSARLKNYDYSSPNWYYITICTKGFKCWFGEVKNRRMILNELGMFADAFWKSIPRHYKTIELDFFVIMPNHIHGIIIINEVETGQLPVSTIPRRPTLGNIVGSYKSVVTKLAHLNKLTEFAWQPRFYDHIIRNENDLFRIRNYIQNNPLKWEIDEYYNH